MRAAGANPESADVVVVGGGAAGCVVAARVAAATSASVLLLEAGPDLRRAMPAQFRDGWRLAPDFDWEYASDPDERDSVEDQRRGKLLGGTSWLTRFAVRGAPADYDEWAALGNPGWAFDDVLPYFRRLEADADFGDEPWHGDDGPIPVDRYRGFDWTEIGAAGLEALEAVGFPPVDDHNRPGAVGAGRMPMSSSDGTRVTTADAYLPLASQNLTVADERQVAHVVFDGTRATGVRLCDDSLVVADQVVLSAGTYGTPPILMRSGIGPADDLRSVGVDVRLDLAEVGANLADHAGVDIDSGYRGEARDAPIFHLLATFHSSGVSSDEAPDLMLWLSDPRGSPPVFEIDVGLLRPRSRGSVRLRSADPADPPRIELPGLRDSYDVERMIEAFARGLEVAHRPELRRVCSGPPSPDPRTRAEIREAIRANSYSYPHVVGTCGMGTVVDPSGRVYGTERLRVVDASIIPNGPSAFTHLPTIMLAERLAEHIAAELR